MTDWVDAVDGDEVARGCQRAARLVGVELRSAARHRRIGERHLVMVEAIAGGAGSAPVRTGTGLDRDLGTAATKAVLQTTPHESLVAASLEALGLRLPLAAALVRGGDLSAEVASGPPSAIDRLRRMVRVLPGDGYLATRTPTAELRALAHRGLMVAVSSGSESAGELDRFLGDLASALDVPIFEPGGVS